MVADFLFRVACHGGGDEPLNVHLKNITDAAYARKTLGGDDIEGELVAIVIAESHDGDCRREIMRHLHECLSEPSGRRWQRIYGGLALTEKLMQHGSPVLLAEVAQGHHFDIVQKVSFLEHFDAAARGCSDRRAQSIVRKRASELRAMLVSQLEHGCSDELGGVDSKDTMSTCSGGVSTATPSTAASSTRSSPSSEFPEPRGPSKELHIDDAFATLREWMESVDSSGASSQGSPRSSSEVSIDDSDWEPLGLPPPFGTADAGQAEPSASGSPQDGALEGRDAADVFFTPMPTPAFAPAPARAATLLSL